VNNNQVLDNLAGLLQKLPGVGPKTSQHFVFYLAKQPKEFLNQLTKAIKEMDAAIRMCRVCFNYSNSDPCPLCLDPRRDKGLLCVVAEPLDLLALEKTAEYRGVYHVLGGVLNGADNLLPQNLKIKELVERIQKPPHQSPAQAGHGTGQARIQEVILGLNANIEGETTALYLTKLLRPLGVRITRLARGLPQGSDLQYADEVTLGNALKGRNQI
jgi:recombination protein RecR